MDVKIVCALIAAGVSLVGALGNLLLISLQKRKFVETLKLDQARLGWDVRAHMMDKRQEIRAETEKHLFDDRVQVFAEILNALTIINDALRALCTEVQGAVTSADDGRDDSWFEDLHASWQQRFIRIVHGRIDEILTTNASHNISFPQELHRLVKDYWRPNLCRMVDDIESLIPTQLRPARPTSRLGGPHNGITEDPERQAMSRLYTLVQNAIWLNRDLKGQLLKALGDHPEANREGRTS